MVQDTRTEEPALPVEHRFSILITDDDRGSRETLAGLLADRGFATVQASSGEEAIEIVQVEIIHLVFFDMHMPRMTGLEALQQVRLINDLLPAIEIALSRYQQIVTLEAEVADMVERFETRKLVDRAKGLLNEKMGLTEPDAFRWIQKASMDRRLTMHDVAQAIIDQLAPKK